MLFQSHTHTHHHHPKIFRKFFNTHKVTALTDSSRPVPPPNSVSKMYKSNQGYLQPINIKGEKCFYKKKQKKEPSPHCPNTDDFVVQGSSLHADPPPKKK